jgi:hypothetical protein
MLVSLAVAALTLRTGLALRRARAGRVAAAPGGRERHLRLAKPAVALLLLGFAAGPLSSVWLRGFEPLRSFHGAVGLAAALCFAAAALAGLRLEAGRSRAYGAHALLAAPGSCSAPSPPPLASPCFRSLYNTSTARWRSQ